MEDDKNINSDNTESEQQDSADSKMDDFLFSDGNDELSKSFFQENTNNLQDVEIEKDENAALEDDFSLDTQISKTNAQKDGGISLSEEETKEISHVIKDFDSTENQDSISDMITVRPVKFQTFEEVEPKRSIKKNLDIMQDVSMHISVELGRTKSSIREVMEMETGSIVELDKIAGEQVEIYVNEKLVAKGEVIVIEDKFGVRVTSTSLPKTEI